MLKQCKDTKSKHRKRLHAKALRDSKKRTPEQVLYGLIVNADG